MHPPKKARGMIPNIKTKPIILFFNLANRRYCFNCRDFINVLWSLSRLLKNRYSERKHNKILASDKTAGAMTVGLSEDFSHITPQLSRLFTVYHVQVVKSLKKRVFFMIRSTPYKYCFKVERTTPKTYGPPMLLHVQFTSDGPSPGAAGNPH